MGAVFLGGQLVVRHPAQAMPYVYGLIFNRADWLNHVWWIGF